MLDENGIHREHCKTDRQMGFRPGVLVLRIHMLRSHNASLVCRYSTLFDTG
jgi:hypothetical protein